MIHALQAVIFDVDSTLADAAYLARLHADCLLPR